MATVCHQHFDALRTLVVCEHVPESGRRCPDCALKWTEARAALDPELDNCPDCIQARVDERDRIQLYNTIDPNQPYGQHITLTCRNHPNLFWSTKNIDYIGARSLFFLSWDKVETGECMCPVSDLEVVPVSTPEERAALDAKLKG